MKKSIRILSAILCSLSLLTLIGCGQSTNSTRENSSEPIVKSASSDPSELQAADSEKQITGDENHKENNILAEDKENKAKIKLYFSNDQATGLVPEIRELKKASIENIVAELILGPNDLNHIATLPDTLKLLKAEVKNKVAYLDFNSEIKKLSGSAGETLGVYSIVNSITELKEIDTVQISVEGEILESIAGHLATDKPLQRNEEIMQ